MAFISGQKFRHELKHYINPVDYITLRQRLKTIMKSDNHGGANGKYKVRSLYFDTPDDKVLREKIDGINNREKFRLRVYDNDFSFIRLEKKSKKNGLCQKLNAKISPAECELIISGGLTLAACRAEPLLVELYAKMQFQRLKPKTIVEYWREAFIYPPGNVRVTLDSDLRTGLSSIDFLNPDAPLIKAHNTIILEVKYDEFLPEIIANIIQIGCRERSAFSKYAACRIVKYI